MSDEHDCNKYYLRCFGKEVMIMQDNIGRYKPSIYFQVNFCPFCGLKAGVNCDDDTLKKQLEMNLFDLGFEARITSKLCDIDVRNLKQLLSTPAHDIYNVKGLGSLSYHKIVDKLKSMGLTMGMVFYEQHD